jgi:peptidoglycan hydrolase CwlO-like protein
VNRFWLFFFSFFSTTHAIDRALSLFDRILVKLDKAIQKVETQVEDIENSIDDAYLKFNDFQNAQYDKKASLLNAQRKAIQATENIRKLTGTA